MKVLHKSVVLNIVVSPSKKYQKSIFIKLAGFLTLTIIVLISCKKDQAELAAFNRNCSCAEEVSADFEIREMTFLSQPQFSTPNVDTIWPNQKVQFTAYEDSADYTWYVGAEIITEKSFIREFTEEFRGQTLPITLVVSKKPNTICLPNDDGKDSIVKTITLSEFDYNNGTLFEQGHHLWEGTFRFKDSVGNYPLKDSFDIVIKMEHAFDPDNPFGQDRMKFSPWGGEIDSVLYGSIGGHNITYRQIWGSFSFLYKWIRLYHKADGRVELECFGSINPARPNLFLIGRKIN